MLSMPPRFALRAVDAREARGHDAAEVCRRAAIETEFFRASYASTSLSAGRDSGSDEANADVEDECRSEALVIIQPDGGMICLGTAPHSRERDR